MDGKRNILQRESIRSIFEIVGENDFIVENIQPEQGSPGLPEIAALPAHLQCGAFPPRGKHGRPLFQPQTVPDKVQEQFTPDS